MISIDGLYLDPTEIAGIDIKTYVNDAIILMKSGKIFIANKKSSEKLGEDLVRQAELADIDRNYPPAQ